MKIYISVKNLHNQKKLGEQYNFKIINDDCRNMLKHIPKGKIQLRDALDFRPRVSDSSNVIGYGGVDSIGAKDYINAGASTVDVPEPSSDATIDFEFYLFVFSHLQILSLNSNYLLFNLHLDLFLFSKAVSRCSPSCPALTHQIPALFP